MATPEQQQAIDYLELQKEKFRTAGLPWEDLLEAIRGYYRSLGMPPYQVEVMVDEYIKRNDLSPIAGGPPPTPMGTYESLDPGDVPGSARDAYNTYLAGLKKTEQEPFTRDPSDIADDATMFTGSTGEFTQAGTGAGSPSLPPAVPDRESTIRRMQRDESLYRQGRQSAFGNILSGLGGFGGLSRAAQETMSRFAPGASARYWLGQAPGILGGTGIWGGAAELPEGADYKEQREAADMQSFADFVGETGIGPQTPGFWRRAVESFRPQDWTYTPGTGGERSGFQYVPQTVQNRTPEEIAQGIAFLGNLQADEAQNILAQQALSGVSPAARRALMSPTGPVSQAFSRWAREDPDVNPGGFLLRGFQNIQRTRNPWSALTASGW